MYRITTTLSAVLSVAVIAAIGSPQPPKIAEPQLPVGFVWHYPLIAHEDECIAETGANVLLSRAPWSQIQPAEDRYDFSILNQQLEFADKHGLHLVVVLEAGPTHAADVPWLMRIVRDAGELQAGPDGKACAPPSFYSPVYLHYLSKYLSKVTGYLASHRLSRVVYGYNNGCEWWYPLSQSYALPDAAAFRKYLRSKYRALASLNSRWGAHFGTWSEVNPPSLFWQGNAETTQGALLPASAEIDACFCTGAGSHVPVSPGQVITFEARFQASGAVRSVQAEIAWLDGSNPRAIKIDRSRLSDAGSANVTATVPANAKYAWLLMKTHGIGKSAFTSVTCHDATGKELAPNPTLDPKLPGWNFVLWSVGEKDKVSHEWTKPGRAIISYAPSAEAIPGCERTLAAVYDWTAFRSNTVSQLMDWMAAEIRSIDTTRPVISYLTFGFSNAFEWDYSQQMGIYIDQHSAMSPHEQITGMQLSGAEGDTDSVTCALDIVRKYGKPMWAIDLLDFTRGTDLGEKDLTRLSTSVVQHGGTGIQYYCWWGTPHYDYSDLGVPALRRMINAVRSEATADAVPRPRVALVMPRMPLYALLSEPANDWSDFMGWYKLLIHEGIRPDVYALEELERKDLTDHKLIIVPDCAYIDPSMLRHLHDALRRGVALVTSGRQAKRDLAGNVLPHANSGDRAKPGKETQFEFPVGSVLLGEVYRQKTPTDTPARLVCRPGSPLWQSTAASKMKKAIALVIH